MEEEKDKKEDNLESNIESKDELKPIENDSKLDDINIEEPEEKPEEKVEEKVEEKPKLEEEVKKEEEEVKEKTYENIEDIDLNIVKNYLRIDHDLDDAELQLFLNSAKSYVKKYIGADKETPLDIELCIPIFNLVSHFYEQRGVTALSNEKIDEIFGDILTVNRMSIL